MRRTREWRSEWLPWLPWTDWRSWLWAFVAAHYWVRYGRLWRWWVDVWLDALRRRREAGE